MRYSRGEGVQREWDTIREIPGVPVAAPDLPSILSFPGLPDQAEQSSTLEGDGIGHFSLPRGEAGFSCSGCCFGGAGPAEEETGPVSPPALGQMGIIALDPPFSPGITGQMGQGERKGQDRPTLPPKGLSKTPGLDREHARLGMWEDSRDHILHIFTFHIESVYAKERLPCYGGKISGKLFTLPIHFGKI